MGDGRALPGRGASRRRGGARSSSGSGTAGPFDDARAGRGGRAPRHPVGRGVRRRGHRHRPHRARAPAPRTSSSRASTASPCSRPSTRRAGSTTSTAGCTGSRRAMPPTRSSATSASAGSSSTRASYEHRYPPLLALRHAADLPGSPTTGSSPSTSSGSRCSTRTRPSSGRPRTWASAWTTGSGTWATGTSRAAGTTACRSRSTPAPAATSPSWARRPSSWSAPRRVDGLEELRRPWVDEVRIRCEGCGGRRCERGRRGGGRLARRRHRPGLDARLGERRVRARGLRDGRGPRSDGADLPTTPTGRSGSPPTGSRRCASRSGSGSARSCHVRRPHRAGSVHEGARLREDARRGRAGRCTARGGT